MEKKNPVLAGLFNMLLPGSGYWYVDRDRRHFLRILIVGAAALAAVIWIGNILQNTTGFPLPQGICTGILLLLVLVPLFMNGQRAAVQHNFVIDNANIYAARQRGSEKAQLERNQDLRDKGYISEQEFESRKDSITNK